MMRVDLTAIHNLMFKFYGSREMQMDTIVEGNHFLRNKEIIIKFDFKKDCNLDIEKLTRRLAILIWKGNCTTFYLFYVLFVLAEKNTKKLLKKISFLFSNNILC